MDAQRLHAQGFHTFGLVELDSCNEYHLLGLTDDLWDCQIKEYQWGCYYYWSEIYVDGCMWAVIHRGKPIYHITKEVGDALQKQSRLNVKGIVDVPMTEKENEIVRTYTELLTK